MSDEENRAELRSQIASLIDQQCEAATRPAFEAPEKTNEDLADEIVELVYYGLMRPAVTSSGETI